ncbi:hypothetical protein LMH87_000430 [Akanthomyces muscarius]|uniref:Protein required for cell viability n=1 Tax=Akanthomyces muscarius TaxID=2231603 RepID=A0A9W8QHW9_AKAMU|nr:hypothetical protein LMH87_000430 [Akanthomyces muscarius]KAJ4155173.1 hypothetical protein LMH87_000430 [Akanthomyces muscarius]
MADASSAQEKKPNLIQDIVDVGKKAFNPASDAVTRDTERQRYEELVKEVDTWTLLHALNALIKPDVVPPWLRQPLMHTLTLLPLRDDGVRGTLELVFSVHPSNAGRADPSPSGGQEQQSQPQKQGASITHEAVAVATKLLSSVPAGMAAEAWFAGIAGQIFALVDGTAGPDLARTAAQIVGFGILGKKVYGAPGAAGWNVFVQPLLEGVNPSLRQSGEVKKEQEEEEVIDLSRPRVLVEADKLQQAIQRLEVLVLSNPSPGLCKRILGRVVLQVWALASWNNPSEAAQKSVHNPAKKLLRTYLQLFGNLESVKPLVSNLTCKGSSSISTPWRYTTTVAGAVEITALPASDTSQPPDLDWTDVEYRATTLAEYISSACSAEDTSSIFLSLLRRWVETAGKQQGDNDIGLISPSQAESDSPMEDLMEVSVLQQLMEKAPEKLISHFDQLLELITQVFEADAKSPLGDEVISVVLSLLNLAVTAPSFQKSDIKPRELQIVEQSLDRLARGDRSDVSGTARNLGMLIKYRDELDDPDDKGKGPPDARKIEDRRTYNLAMGYITGDKENPPPIVAEGLKLLSGLITAESPILDITAITVLLSNLLKENEDYINLQVVRMFTQLANKHPKTTMKELLDNYLDAQEKSTTDTRLRFGEALVQVIERLGQTFTGDLAQQTGETLLSIAGRRGHRPKTLARQAREERMHKLKNEKRARQEAAGLAPPREDEEEEMNTDDDEEELTDEDKAKNDVLAQIIQGWESKRGSEDIRMRTSALSILGAALESHLRGIGPVIASASVDLCLHVLTLEPELERGILRRAAIVVILSFVRALAAAQEEASSSYLGFGLTAESRADIQRSLEYIAATDNDGLVREHARDVIESLETWRVTSMLPRATDAGSSDGGGLARLAGLQVNPGLSSGQQRPRIEEIE